MNTSLSAAALASLRLAAGSFLVSGLLVAQTSVKPAVETSTATSGETMKLEKFEITGSRIKRADAEGPSPIKVINRQEIESTGRTNLTDLLRDMPEATFTGINEGGTTAAVRGSTALNLRNLGANNTLVIINGRRTVVTANASGGTTFVDVNRIPISMVERIEILKDGASAIYGADATAGVVNIILRKDYSGMELTGSYGNSTKTDVGEKSVSLFAGAASGKASATVGISYFQRGALKGIDTSFGQNADLSARYAAKGNHYAADLAAGSGFYDLRSGTGPQARVGLTGAAAGQVNGINGVNIPGLAAGAAITTLPGTGRASATPSFTNPSQQGTGGQFNAALAGTYVAQILTPRSTPSNLYNFQEWVWLTPEVERTGMSTTFRFDLTKNMNFYAEASYQQNKTHIELAPSPISTAGDNSIIVPKTNFYNPFGVDVSFNYRPVDFGAREADILNDSFRYLFGLQGNILSKFDWDTAYTYGYDQVTDVTSNAMSESRLRAALARTDATAMNIFGGPGFRNNPATLNSIRVKTQKAGTASLDLWDAKISGEVFELPMGPIGAAIYTEIRKEKFNVANDAISTSLDDIIGQVRLEDATRARRVVKSVAAEIGMPLVKTATIPFIYKLDLSVAGRFETFTDGYDSGVKPFYGLRYQPVKDLLIRGSIGKSFRAPTLPQLFGGERQSLPNGLADLRRPQLLTGDAFDGAATQRLVRQGGNPNLTPELAETSQYGFIYDVPFKPLQGLSIGASFFSISQKNIITTTGTGFIRQNEVGGGTADLVIRDSGTESYRNNTANPINVLSGPNNAVTAVAPGQTVTVPGRIVQILDRTVNLALQEVEGYDMEIIYNKRTVNYGRFNWRNSGTYTKFYGFTRTSGPQNVVGRDGYPRYRIASNLDWELKQHRAGLSYNFINRYGDYNRDGFEVARYYTVGAYYGYDLPAGISDWLNNTRLIFGVDNLLDKEPSLYYNGVGYDQGYVSRPAGRFFSFGATKRF